jgi:UTP-glucose-1-phosphate uridylyltransferase
MGKKLDYLKTTVEVALTHPELADGFRDYLRDVVRREGLG